MTIKVEKGKWVIDGKHFENMTPNEKIILDQYFENEKNRSK